MNPLIMKALLEGAALLIGSFARTAATKGLSVILLVLGFGGAVWFATWQRAQFLEIIEHNKTECKTEIDSLEKRLEHCEEIRRQHEIRLAVLETLEKARSNQKRVK